MVVVKPRELKPARRFMYNRLADFLINNVDVDRISTVLEAGCGSGRLTVPLAEKVGEGRRIIAFDIFSGPYGGDLGILRRAIQWQGLRDIIMAVKGDVRNMGIGNETVDLIVSNELFCDLDRHGLERTLKEFYRVLKPKGQMAHAELNPFPENRAQEILIEADSYSLKTLTPRPPWFSPSADEVAILMHKIGFRNILVKYFETNLRLSFEVAVAQLKEWNMDLDFISKCEEDLRRYGLEFPMEHVIFCEKTSEK